MTQPAQPRAPRDHLPLVKGPLKIVAAVILARDKVVKAERFSTLAKFTVLGLVFPYRHNVQV